MLMMFKDADASEDKPRTEGDAHSGRLRAVTREKQLVLLRLANSLGISHRPHQSEAPCSVYVPLI